MEATAFFHFNYNEPIQAVFRIFLNNKIQYALEQPHIPNQKF